MKYFKFLFFIMCLSAKLSYADSYIVNTSVLNLRTCASVNCNIKGKLLIGEEVEVEEQSGSWVKVATKKGTGFVVFRSLKLRRDTFSNIRADNDADAILLLCVILLFVLFFVYRIWKLKKNRELIQTVTSLDRGEPTELELILELLKSGFSPDSIFHDLYITKADGDFSQIDLVMLTTVGIIVFEVKDYSGWIFGKGNDNKWTKVLAYGRSKYRFYNPVVQNQNHINELKRIIGENIPFYSVIVFYGNCKLKDISFIPKRTFVTKDYCVQDALNAIFNEASKFEYEDKDKIIELLREAVNKGNDINVSSQHISNIKEMLGTERVFR